MEEINDIYIGF